MSGTELVRNLLKNIPNEINYNDSEVEIKPVSSGGANYTSGLYEVTVSNKNEETLHLFAKVAIMNDHMRTSLGSQSIFSLEDKFYRKMATSFEEMENKYGIPKDERFVVSKLFGSSLEVGYETFLFENLNAKGYRIYDRFETLDHQCMFDTIAALAKFHALGLALEKERPELYKEFESLDLSEAIGTWLDSAHDQIPKTIQALDKEYRDRIAKFLEDYNYEEFKMFFTRKGKFLIHGDYRPSNILYKKQADRVAVVPVDYQSVRVGKVSTDLLYFITMSSDEAFRVKHFDELVEHYYTELSSYSSKLGIDLGEVYTRQMFQDEVKEVLPATLLLALTFFPLILVEADDAPVVSDSNMKLSDFFVNANNKSTERLAGYVRDLMRWGII